MKEGRNNSIWVGVLSVIAVIVSLVTLAAIYKISGDIKELEAKITYIEGKLSNLSSIVKVIDTSLQSLKEGYDNRIAILENKTNELKKEIKDINVTIRSIKDDIEGLRNIIKYIEEANDFIKGWLMQNIDTSFLRKNFPRTYRELYRCCIGDTCNFACVLYLIHDKDGYSYKYDNETVGYDDKLFSLQDFVKYKGGDCEDWAFFTMKLIEYLRSKGIYYIKVPKYVDDPSYTYTIYENSTDIVYLKGATEYTINIKEYKPYVVCYWYSDIGFTYIGHCAVALCKSDIYGDTIEDVSYKIVDNCIIVEPLSYGAMREVIPSEDYFIIRFPDGSYEVTTNGFDIIIGNDTICYAPEEEFYCIR